MSQHSSPDSAKLSRTWSLGSVALGAKRYYRLTKPGIIYGNAITVAAGFFFASKGVIDLGLFLATLAGVSLVIGSACVFNNYIDRGIDAKMSRTKQRATVTGHISGRQDLSFATVLGFAGLGLLVAFTNITTVVVGLIGLVFYVILYGVAKRRSVYGTEVGSVAGAMPIVAGYTAITGQLDMTAGLLFLILAFWQMPHFYAIALFRISDYANAGLPVMPVKRGVDVTKQRMLAYIVCFALACAALALAGGANYTTLVVSLAASGAWLWRGLRHYSTTDTTLWARGLFGFSLLVLLAFSISIASSAWLP